jgi:hypothetical protein
LHLRTLHHTAARLAELLDLGGVPQKSLSLEALSDLQLWAQLCCALKVTQASPQVLLAAWAMQLVNHSKATIMHVSPSTRQAHVLSPTVCKCAAAL